MTNFGSTMPLHMTLTILMLDGYERRDVPARSAAVKVHQLQKNATIWGSNSLIASNSLMK
jgi:hypothetical protein